MEGECMADTTDWGMWEGEGNREKDERTAKRALNVGNGVLTDC